jgi:hypothetical protein
MAGFVGSNPGPAMGGSGSLPRRARKIITRLRMRTRTGSVALRQFIVFSLLLPGKRSKKISIRTRGRKGHRVAFYAPNGAELSLAAGWSRLMVTSADGIVSRG